ncbi:unnamed protein product [Pleuronectes platessa]|uniref:Uncharacterized protein n=1 Tax=Pleuronectes platessa TaxID=8262 RepID=A0A9N7ZEA9_PLEPL|nr:unnamed protein product [Pleuronectes platessa]
MDSGIVFKGSAPEESKGDGQDRNAEVVPGSLGGGTQRGARQACGQIGLLAVSLTSCPLAPSYIKCFCKARKDWQVHENGRPVVDLPVLVISGESSCTVLGCEHWSQFGHFPERVKHVSSSSSGEPRALPWPDEIPDLSSVFQVNPGACDQLDRPQEPAEEGAEESSQPGQEHEDDEEWDEGLGSFLLLSCSGPEGKKEDTQTDRDRDRDSATNRLQDKMPTTIASLNLGQTSDVSDFTH